MIVTSPKLPLSPSCPLALFLLAYSSSMPLAAFIYLSTLPTACQYIPLIVNHLSVPPQLLISTCYCVLTSCLAIGTYFLILPGLSSFAFWYAFLVLISLFSSPVITVQLTSAYLSFLLAPVLTYMATSTSYYLFYHVQTFISLMSINPITSPPFLSLSPSRHPYTISTLTTLSPYPSTSPKRLSL